MRVLISGAGMAGLTLAALLRQRGIHADIIDHAADFDHAGYVLGLYPLGSRVLHGLGLYDEFARVSEAMNDYIVASSRGRELKRFDFRPFTQAHGDIRMLGRGDLLQILRSACGDTPIRLSTTIATMSDDGDVVRVRTSDGVEKDYDLVVGADGIHAQSRRHVSPHNDIYDTKWACWAWWADRDDLPEGTIHEQWGAGRFVGLYPTPERLGVIAAAPARALGFGARQGRQMRMYDVFSKMKGPARDIIDHLPGDDADMFYWKLDDQRARHWIKGRVVLLGDAAAAFLPTTGIGASMAMESAAVLADELSRANARSVPLALSFYERRRRARVEAAQDDSRKLSRMMFLRSPILSLARNQSVKMMSLKGLAKDIVKLLGEPI
jgi:2-polyprenyl-6-methoxyphenol hydroxylase-like FAD-dependent oxidoreductase